MQYSKGRQFKQETSILNGQVSKKVEPNRHFKNTTGTLDLCINKEKNSAMDVINEIKFFVKQEALKNKVLQSLQS